MCEERKDSKAYLSRTETLLATDRDIVGDGQFFLSLSLPLLFFLLSRSLFFCFQGTYDCSLNIELFPSHEREDFRLFIVIVSLVVRV